MKALNIIVVSTFLFVFCDTEPVGCQNTYPVPVKKENDKTLVSVRIGNVTIPNILLDTGFSYDGIIIYNQSYRDSIDLAEAVEVTLGGAGSGNAQNGLMLDSASFQLGNKTLSGQRVIVLLSDIYKGFPSNGIIGYSLFGHYAVEINYDKNLLILHEFDTFKPDPQYTRIPIWFKDNMIPWIEAGIIISNEEPEILSAYIDLADRDPLVLLEQPSMKFSMPEGTEMKFLGRGLSGDIYGKTGKISRLTIGPYQMNNINVSIAPAEVRSKQKNADAVIGCGTLNRFNFVLDYRNKYLYLKPNKTFNNPI